MADKEKAAQLGTREGASFAMTVENRCWISNVAFAAFLVHVQSGRLVQDDVVVYGEAFLAAAAGKGS